MKSVVHMAIGLVLLLPSYAFAVKYAPELRSDERIATTYAIAIVVAAVIVGAAIFFGLRSKNQKQNETHEA
jgi:hypothetical protein